MIILPIILAKNKNNTGTETQKNIPKLTAPQVTVHNAASTTPDCLSQQLTSGLDEPV